MRPTTTVIVCLSVAGVSALPIPTSDGDSVVAASAIPTTIEFPMNKRENDEVTIQDDKEQQPDPEQEQEAYITLDTAPESADGKLAVLESTIGKPPPSLPPKKKKHWKAATGYSILAIGALAILGFFAYSALGPASDTKSSKSPVASLRPFSAGDVASLPGSGSSRSIYPASDTSSFVHTVNGSHTGLNNLPGAKAPVSSWLDRVRPGSVIHAPSIDSQSSSFVSAASHDVPNPWFWQGRAGDAVAGIGNAFTSGSDAS